MRTNMKDFFTIGQAILAAALFGMSAPFSKLLLQELSPYLMSSLLYLGAGLGMLLVYILRFRFQKEHKEAKLSREELPYVVMMILLDIAAPIFLMLGLLSTTSSTASLLNNFEIVATSIIALIVFREAIGKRLWLSICLITMSSVILSVTDIGNLSFSLGSVLVLLACLCWGLENNCTRKLSIKDPMQIVIIKGIFSGLGALLIAYFSRTITINLPYILMALLLGFFAYGMSIFFYVSAQRHLGAARTSTYYAVAPFIGVGISLLVFKEPITPSFITASIVMLTGTYFAVVEKHEHIHTHEFLQHEHRHSHEDGHHNHTHPDCTHKEHTHVHIHENLEHVHRHKPDIHHAHQH